MRALQLRNARQRGAGTVAAPDTNASGGGGDAARGTATASRRPRPPPPLSLDGAKPCLADFAIDSRAPALGTGAFCVVRRAVHVASGAAFALKSVDRAALGRAARRAPAAAGEVLVEKALAARVGGAFAPALAATWAEPPGPAGALLLCYRLAARGELWTRLRTRGGPAPLDARAAAAVVAALARGLAHAHARGVAHRDLKPENVVLDDDVEGSDEAGDGGGGEGSGEPDAARPFPTSVVALLCDWASAKDVLSARAPPAGECVGTPEYMAPEAVSGGRRGEPTDTAADLWSLGALAFRLLAGVTPLPAPSAFRAMERAVAHTGRAACVCGGGDGGGEGEGDGAAAGGEDEGEPDGLLFPPGLDAAARAFVRRLLQPDPERRLGVTGRAPRGEPADWRAADALARADERAGAGAAGRPPGWQWDAPSTLDEDGGGGAAGGAAPGGPGGPGGRRPPPPRVSRPCLVDHDALLAHPFLAAAARGCPPGSPRVPAAPADAAHARALELTDAAAGAPRLRAASRARAMADGVPVAGSRDGGGGDGDDGAAVDAWRGVRARLLACSAAERARVAHLLALRGALTRPSTLALLFAHHATARTARVEVAEWGPCEGSAHGGDAPRAGRAGSGWARRRVGGAPPRALLAWGAAAAGSSSSAAADGDAGDAWTGPLYVALLPVGPHDGPRALARFARALAALRPPPAAVVVLTALDEAAAAAAAAPGGGDAPPPAGADARAVFASPFDAPPDALALALAAALAGAPDTLVLAPSRVPAGALGAAASARGTRLLYVERGGGRGGPAWAAGEAAAALSTHTHSLLFLSGGALGGGAVPDDGAAASPAAAAAASNARVVEAVAAVETGVRYVFSAAGASARAAPAVVAPAAWAAGEGAEWRALRGSEVARAAVPRGAPPGARALKTITLPLVSVLAGEGEGAEAGEGAGGGGGGGGGEGGGGDGATPGEVPSAHDERPPPAVLVPVVKLWPTRAQPGYVTVADGARDVRVALEDVEGPAAA